ncbi:hypothetical protein CN300_13795 [Bacillus thuringiensis]|nr:hypothetical protein F8510_24235 [Bacillus sp. RM2(2019)]PEV05008.1 hypothetical protein CN418_29435 [Bacillus thuringiensis]PFC44628.1 hypothetical protein CN300_13795 [Bacillus thuringiensis]PGW61964.1 hypothetical protein COE14_02365 [Bacillus thuringiensis]
MYKSTKKRHPKVPSSDLNHFNSKNMYWTPIQILFFSTNNWYILGGESYFYVKIFWVLFILF